MFYWLLLQQPKICFVKMLVLTENISRMKILVMIILVTESILLAPDTNLKVSHNASSPAFNETVFSLKEIKTTIHVIFKLSRGG